MLTIQRDLKDETPLIELNPAEIQMVSGGDAFFPDWMVVGFRWITAHCPTQDQPIDTQGGIRG
jgi:hypothetical protein